ncbi:Ig-like domain-containing protein, partial [Acinetobacter ursingii]
VKDQDGNVIGTAEVGEDGNYVVELSPAQNSGEDLTVNATDKAGNVSPDVSVSTPDTTAPDAPTAVLNEDGSQITGTGEPGSTIEVKDQDGNVIGTAEVGEDGNYVVELSPAQNSGEDLTVNATDKAGNVSPDVIINTPDTTAPEAIIEITGISEDTGVAGDFITRDTSLTIQGTVGALQAGEKAQISVDGGTTWSDLTVSNGTWSYADSRTLTDDSYTYQVRVIDNAGNVGSTDSQIVTVDTTAPNAPTDVEIKANEDDTATIIGKGEPGTTVVVTPPGGGDPIESVVKPDGTFEVSVPGPASDGKYEVITKDDAGNESPKSEVTLDTAAPDVSDLTTTFEVDVDTANGVSGSGSTNTTVSTNNDLLTRDSTPTEVSGELNRALNADEMLQISLDGGKTWNDVTLTDTNWRFVLPDVTYTKDAEINFQLRVRDQANNASELNDSNRKVIVDVTSPDAITARPDIESVTNINKSYIFDSTKYGKAEAGSTIALINDVNNNGMWQEGLDKVIATAIVNADGTWSITTTLPAGALNVGFVVWDAAGNNSAMGSTVSTGVASTEGGSQSIDTGWGGTTTPTNGINAAAVTINADGNWSFFQSVRDNTGAGPKFAGRIYDAVGVDKYDSTYLSEPNGIGGGTWYGRYVNSVMFTDLNRDGHIDVMSQVSEYDTTNASTAYWINNGDGTYTAQKFEQRAGATNILNHFGGALAYDRTGDGYIDFMLADSEGDSSSFVRNNKGVLVEEPTVAGQYSQAPSGAWTIQNGQGTSSITGVKMTNNLGFMHEVGGADLDNNGTIDLLGHTNQNNGAFVGNLGRDLAILYNTGDEAKGFTYTYAKNVFANDGYQDYGTLSQNITFADFNGDGWLDMYLNRGANQAGTANSNESRIYLNDGTGKLLTSGSDALWFGDNKFGATSFAVDWNFDGKVDVIEIPTMPVGPDNNDKKQFNPTLYVNDGTGVWGQNAQDLANIDFSTSKITGAVVVDYDWDGSLDLILYRGGTDAAVSQKDNSATSILVKNTNVAADGTSLQIRILDGDGINSFYGNTVKLYNSKGELVSTQLINPQSAGSSNSMGLVSFYGLDANETYSVQLLRITNGVSNNISGVDGLGGYATGTLNTTWTGLTTGKAHDSYVLTAEKSSDVNDSSVKSGISGTGYNDHFFGSLGNDSYNGGGGWIINASGNKEWVAKGGEDILDYSGLDAKITVDIDTGIVTKVVNVDGNYVTYIDNVVNIEKFITGSGDTVFNGGKGNDIFVGGQGDDTYNLGNAGNGSDTIYFALKNAEDVTGGNGTDTVNGFNVGKVGENASATIIDIHELLDDYTGSVGLYKDTDGYKLNGSSSELLKYLQVSSDGTNTTISIDRDGGGDHFTTLVTLHNVDTDLITLLMNNQLVI